MRINPMLSLQEFINMPSNHQIDNRSLTVEVYRKVEEIIDIVNGMYEFQLAQVNKSNTEALK